MEMNNNNKEKKSVTELNNDCAICGQDLWEDLDRLRDHDCWYQQSFREEKEPVGFQICKNCGYCTYKPIASERLQEIYDNQRKSVIADNFVTSARKDVYHDIFLEEYYHLWNTKSKILDVGMAQGSLLKMLMDKTDVVAPNCYGTEWSDSFRKYAKFEYGVNATHEIDESLQYDFISYYHVLEHIQRPDLELDKVRHILKSDGLVYISVPWWFENIEESSGEQTIDFEKYFHLNHCCVFSRTSFRNLLRVKGFEIIKEDMDLYGFTVVCKLCDSSDDIVKEDWKVLVKIIERQKKAIVTLKDNQQKAEKAVKIYPAYPDAYLLYCMTHENASDFKKLAEMLVKGRKECPGSARVLYQEAVVHYQWDENTPEKQFYSNNIKKAEKIFLEIDKIKPLEDVYYFLGQINLMYKKEYDVAVEYYKKVIAINPIRYKEIMNQICLCWKEKPELEN